MPTKVKNNKQKNGSKHLTADQLERLLKKRDEEKAKENGQVIGGIFVFVIVVILLVGVGFGIYYGIHYLKTNRDKERLTKAYESCLTMYGSGDNRCNEIYIKLKLLDEK